MVQFRHGKRNDLRPVETQMYDLLLKNGYNPKTVYEWLLLEKIPAHLREKLESNKIGMRAARYEYVKWKTMNHEFAGKQLRNDIRKIVRCLRWESQEQ